jgi:hypothetical protein
MKYAVMACVLAVSSGWASAQKSTNANTSVARKLSACKQAAGYNPIKRENCVWSICKGRWGRDGCPAQNKIDNNKR